MILFLGRIKHRLYFDLGIFSVFSKFPVVVEPVLKGVGSLGIHCELHFGNILGTVVQYEVD